MAGRICDSLGLMAIDTVLDENREIVVKDNYTLAILRHFLNPDIIHVAIPVIYNICMDFGEHSSLSRFIFRLG